MDVIRFAITNPVKVTVGAMLIILFGVLSVFTIPIQLTPNVDQPIITIRTNWTGRSPEEVEREVIEPQEDKLKGVSSLRKMTAVAYTGLAQIELEFHIGTDMRRVLQETSDSLREVPDYPEGVDQPVVNMSENEPSRAMAWLVLASDDPNFNVESLKDVAEDRIKPQLERVDGITETPVYGGREREVHIQIDPRRLAQRGITFNQLQSALRLENVNISAGDLAEGTRDVRIRVIGQYDSIEQIQQTIVADTPGGPIRVKDLGDAVQTLEKRRNFVRSKGRSALAMPVYRESGSNVMRVMADLRKAIDYVNTSILPTVAPGLKLEQAYDETIYVADAINLVINNLWIGGTLAIGALLLFLRKVRPTVIIAVAIPISVIGTFVAMTVAGRNLNVVSLAGLAFAVGMVVDAAIVVLENIDRHLGLGKKPFDAAYDGGKEVWGAILASTLTTLAVFVPVLSIREEAGQLFRDIALAITAAVSLSLIVAVTVIPSSAAHFLKPEVKAEGRNRRMVQGLFGLAASMGWLVGRFADMIYWLCERTGPRAMMRLGIVGSLTLASIGGAYMLMPPATYLPRGNQNFVFGFMLTPPAYTVDQNESIAHRVEQRLRPYWDAKSPQELAQVPPMINLQTQQPIANIPVIDNSFFVSFFMGMFTGVTSADKQNVQPLQDVLSSVINTTVPGMFGGAEQASLFGRGIGGNAVDVEIVGTDLDRIRSSAAALYGSLAQRFGLLKIRPDPMNFNLPGPELQIRIDRVKAAELGIDVTALGHGVQALIDGLAIGDYRLAGESIDLVAVRPPDMELTPQTLATIPIAYRDRQGRSGIVPLASVATITQADAPQQINRVEEMRAVTLVVIAPDEMPLEQAEQEILDRVGPLRAAGAITPDVEVRLAGTAAKLTEVREALLGSWHGWTLDSLKSFVFSRMFLALVVTYLLMAALFESFLYPFVIMFTVPLATVGGFMGLAITHAFVKTQLLDVLTMLGFVILIGVVVNNAILIVHQALNFMRGVSETGDQVYQALEPRAAIRESVRTRIRPVFMTTITSVCGMLPLVLMPGSGSELYKGLGSVVVGGLICATIFTLIVVPLLFSVVLDAKQALFGRGKTLTF